MDAGHRLARGASLWAAFFAFASDDGPRSDARFRAVTGLLRLTAVILAPVVLALGGLAMFVWHVVDRAPLER